MRLDHGLDDDFAVERAREPGEAVAALPLEVRRQVGVHVDDDVALAVPADLGLHGPKDLRALLNVTRPPCPGSGGGEAGAAGAAAGCPTAQAQRRVSSA